MRYLAIDYGLKRTGLAVCDKSETICSPLAVLDKPDRLIEQILETMKSEQIEVVVIGLPLNMDGSEGPQAKLVEEFAEMLKLEVSVPIYFQDERLSSFAAGEKLSDIEMSQARKKKRIDAVAAADLLEAFLEGKRQEG